MKFLLVLLFLSFAIQANDKVALVMGDDCHETGPFRMAKLAAKTAKILKSKGYQVTNLYGDEKRAKEVFTKHVGDKSIIQKPLSLKSIQSSLAAQYNKPCSERAEQMMLNFVAHGSRNGGNHTICLSKKRGAIPVRNIASYLKKLKSKDPSCNKPIVGIVDCSCKSGGSIKEFEGLGCTLSTTGSNNKTSLNFVETYLQNINKMNSASSLTDLHLKLLLKRTYNLHNNEIKEGKISLKKFFWDLNQVSGCYDERAGHFNLGLEQKTDLSCSAPLRIMSKTKEQDIKTVQSIIGKIQTKEEINKNTIAKALGQSPSQVPSLEELQKKLNAILKEDEKANQVFNKKIKEESALLTNPKLKEKLNCKIQVPKKASMNQVLKLKNILKSGTNTHKQSIVQALCHTIYDPKKQFTQFKICSKYKTSGTLSLNHAEVIKLHKEFNLLKQAYKKDHSKEVIARYKNKDRIPLHMNLLLSTQEETIKKCFNKIQNSSLSEAKLAAQFVTDNYICQNESLGCEILKAKKREKEIKKYFGLARAYYFLGCKNKFNKTNDLKTCDDFKL